MTKSLALAGLTLFAAGAVVAGCGGGGDDPGGNGEAAVEDYSRPDVPVEYADIEVPAFTDAMAEEGKKNFGVHCATCHGPEGKGDGPAGMALKPPAQDLTNPELQAALNDKYMYWRISEGGEALGYSGMTPFKSTFTEEERWELVAFIRSLVKS